MNTPKNRALDFASALSRRRFLEIPAAVAAVLTVSNTSSAAEAASRTTAGAAQPAALEIALGEHRVISRLAVREPSLLKLRSGDLLLTFHAQGDLHFAERKGLRSSDGGRTWRTEPRRGHREQSIGQNAQGLVIAPDMYTFERRPGEYVGSYFQSKDGGATFSGPFELVVRVNRVAATGYPTPEHIPPDGHPLRKFYQPLPEYYHRVVQAASTRRGPSFWRYLIERDGRWLAAMQCHFHGDIGLRTILVESFDNGKNWAFVSSIAYRHGGQGDGFCEPVLMRVPDGSLLCVLRRGGGMPLGQSRSLTDGKTWSPVETLHAHGVDPDLCLMANGVLVGTYGRPGLHLMFSLDGCGREWTHFTPIGDWRSSTYMGIVEIAHDELLLMYDRNDSPAGTEPRPVDSFVGAMTVRVSRTSSSGPARSL
jgi:hypothetical protein